MSKELEALQKLRDLVEYLTRIDYVPADLRNEVKELLINSYEDSNGYFSQIEQALNELEDAKHNYKALKEYYDNAVTFATKIQNELNELKKSEEELTSKNKNILRMPIPNTNSFGTDFTPNHLTEEEAIEVLRQAYQTIAKKKRSNKK